MKRLVMLLVSFSLVAVFASTKDVSVPKSTHDVIAYESQPNYHPIQPPIG